ncbi:hypothetical protein G5I_14294 [Acromyrmex echinatior]|uniref:Uncharacterized protein n=1 Tax=Acromyrmex echinatior TaxID=103372 RepID=F4X704_ACREC|nr:hypothetical protein G5I_14294 [Acromyrmex echinatior]
MASSHQCSAPDMARKNSRRKRTSPFRSETLEFPPLSSLTNFRNLFGEAGKERERVSRTKTRQEKSFRPFLRGGKKRAEPDRASVMPKGCEKEKATLSLHSMSQQLSVSFDKLRALGRFGVGFHTAQRPNYP